jgi:hypothetical protein
MSMYAPKTNPRIPSAKRSQAAAAGGAGRSPGSQPKVPPVGPQWMVTYTTVIQYCPHPALPRKRGRELKGPPA